MAQLKKTLYLGKEKEKKAPSDGCSFILKDHAMTYFFSHRRVDNIKIPTFSTYTFQTFVKVIQNATPHLEANITNMTLQK